MIWSTKRRTLQSVIEAVVLCLLFSSAFGQSRVPTNSEKLAIVNDAESALERFDKITRGVEFAKSGSSEPQLSDAQEALKGARRRVSDMRELIAVRRTTGEVSNTLLFFAYVSIQEVATRAGNLAAIASAMNDSSLAASLSQLKDELAGPRERAFTTLSNHMVALDLGDTNCKHQP